MKLAFKRPYIYWVIGISVIYILINLLVSGFYNTLPLIIRYALTINWGKILVSLLLTIVIGFLVSLTAVYTYIRFRERKRCAKGATTASVGAVGGLVVGVCPLCITGLFPLIFSLFGATLSFASLPLGGIEVQVGVVIILLISLKLLRIN